MSRGLVPLLTTVLIPGCLAAAHREEVESRTTTIAQLRHEGEAAAQHSVELQSEHRQLRVALVEAGDRAQLAWCNRIAEELRAEVFRRQRRSAAARARFHLCLAENAAEPSRTCLLRLAVDDEGRWEGCMGETDASPLVATCGEEPPAVSSTRDIVASMRLGEPAGCPVAKRAFGD